MSHLESDPRAAHPIARRTLLKAAAAGAVAPLVGLAGRALAQSGAPLKKLRLTWNATAICTSPVAVAVDKGIFAKYRLDVELVNFGASTEALLEAIATGKADAGVGMALRWMKPLEQGFDVKVVAATHGGCSRLIAPAGAGIARIEDLKGKAIGVSDLAAPGKNFFSIMMTKAGLDPTRDVEWRQYPGELLTAAADKGEIQAIADGDPKAWMWMKDGKFVQVASNLDGEYANRMCCILGLRGSLLRDDPAAAAALTRAVLEAQDWTVARPQDAAQSFIKYTPKVAEADLVAMLQSQTHQHHPVGTDLKAEIALLADELKLVGVFKPSTDPAKFATKVYADVLAA